MLHEDTITSKLVDILEEMHSAWNLEPQNTQTFLRESQRPDITVKENGRNPVVIEVKIDEPNADNLSGEPQAREHLGRQLSSYEKVTTAMALRVPHQFRLASHRELETRLRRTDALHYVLLSLDEHGDVHRFPKAGWVQGSLADVATAIRIGAIPNTSVAQAAYDLEHGVNEASTLLAAAVETRPGLAENVQRILYQEAGEQTYRMAMLIITNAFVFQSTLAGTAEMERVPSLRQLRTVEEHLNSHDILAAWDTIRKVNYRPIFDVAYELILALATDDSLVGKVLYLLRNTAQKLVDRGLAQVHELAGIVFQRLIVDRKFIKTYYTRPESVALLSTLVVQRCVAGFQIGLTRVNKGGGSRFADIKVADFACGTGALLNGVYQCLLALHEQAGGNARDIHQHMVENNLVGCDVMPNASHLTAAILASANPDIKIGKTRIHTMAYGSQRSDGQYALGALDLLENPQATLPLGLINTERVQGDGIGDADESPEFQHGEFHIVVDNPPFARAGSDNNSKNRDVPKTVFGDKDAKIAKEMRAYLGKIANSLGNINAGLGSYFVELANKMLANEGVMGFVLPIPVLTSPDWQKVRDLWAREYHHVTVITIADAQIRDCSFSQDTKMAECLVLAVKGRGDTTGRGTFVCLDRRPDSYLEGVEIAKAINALQHVKGFEEPPIGGSPITVGEGKVGHALNCPLQSEPLWVAARVKDFSLIQSYHHLKSGNLWLPGQAQSACIPMTTVGQIATVHSYDERKNSSGPFEIEKGHSPPDLYPGLWALNSENQRAMVVQPDCHATIRSGQWDKAQQVLAKIGRAHHNAKLQFNANSLAVLFTERPAIGVNLRPSVVFENNLFDYVWCLWGNSTLGLLCYWAHSSKQQTGRGQIRLKALRSMPTLDVRQLDETALQNATDIFEAMKHEKMLPFNQMDEDVVRQKLDRRLLAEVLGFGEETHPEVHEGLRLLRERLCAEPSIHGAKKSRVVL